MNEATTEHSIGCMEIIGGNRATQELVHAPALDIWIDSRPLESDAGGGDIHYVSTCGAGYVTRLALADVSGHGVGRTIHEPPTVHNHYFPMQRDVLTEGMVLTIEPLISAGSADVVTDKDGWTLRTSDGSLAAHHEHTLVITAGAPVLLTAA